MCYEYYNFKRWYTKEIEAIIAKAGPTQTIRIEQAPLKIIGVSDTDNKDSYKL